MRDVRFSTELFWNRLWSCWFRSRMLPPVIVIRREDMLVVQEVDRLGCNLLVLNGLLKQCIQVKVLHGIASTPSAASSSTLPSSRSRTGAARSPVRPVTASPQPPSAGARAGRPQVGRRRQASRDPGTAAEGQSLREISRGGGVSVAVAHSEVKAAEEAALSARDLT